MPRAERLSSRLEILLDAIFDAPSDPFSLYWDIAALLDHDQLAHAQKKIKKRLEQKGEIGTESAVLLACVLHLTGFPPHRVMHFLSLYVRAGIHLSLYELAVGAIFLGNPPIPSQLLYDLTQYTYLEKRLLARKSLEISEKLKGSLNPAVLLFLYLVSLRDDLSNENIQLVALIMKNCFPALEVRTRIGGASLEEYGEIARAWKSAEERSLALDSFAGAGPEKREMRAFDRDSASFFLDKYFSDTALAEMREAAPLASAKAAPAASKARAAGAAAASADEIAPPPAARRERTLRPDAKPAVAAARSEEKPAAPSRKRMAARTAPDAPVAPLPLVAARRERGTRPGRGAPRKLPAALSRPPVPDPGPAAGQRRAAADRPAGALRAVLLTAPIILAAAAVAAFLLAVGAPQRTGEAPSASTPTPAPSVAAAPAAGGPVVVNEAPPEGPAPDTTTYVVRPGDSLWKIFTSLRRSGMDEKGWAEFLSKTRTMNSLSDPDRLHPGKVLTLTKPPH